VAHAGLFGDQTLLPVAAFESSWCSLRDAAVRLANSSLVWRRRPFLSFFSLLDFNVAF